MQILANFRRRWTILAGWIVVTSLASVIGYAQSNTVLYQGARLIIGDASAPIETGEFLVQNGRITAIGPKGSIRAPARASRIDLTGKTSIADAMVVTSGRSNRHVAACADRVVEGLHQAGIADVRVEGMPHCDWVLIDAGDVIVHVFRPEVRTFYQLEKMWARGPKAKAS